MRKRITSTSFTPAELSLIRKTMLASTRDQELAPEKKNQLLGITLKIEELMQPVRRRDLEVVGRISNSQSKGITMC